MAPDVIRAVRGHAMSRWHWSLDRKRWSLVRREALDRDGWRCTTCGAAGRLEVHHRTSIRDAPGKAYALANLRTLCRPCHFRLHNERALEERRARMPKTTRKWYKLVEVLANDQGG